MKKIKVTEMFYSTQGEGRYVGAPSVFLRTFGCNFQCRGFNMPKGQLTTEPEDILARIDLSSIKKIDELPLAQTGCDSWVSWHPKVKHLAPSYDIDTLVQMLVDQTPNKSFDGIHLVITGGEPLLGWQKAYVELLNILIDKHKLSHITFETNGTQKLIPELSQLISDRYMTIFHFSVSAKLPCSGEKWEDTIKPEVVKEYTYSAYVDLKLVVDPNQTGSFEHAELAVQTYEDASVFVDRVYLMAEGGTENTYARNEPIVAEYALKKGWYYSPRLHISLFGNSWGT